MESLFLTKSPFLYCKIANKKYEKENIIKLATAFYGKLCIACIISIKTSFRKEWLRSGNLLLEFIFVFIFEELL